MLCLGESLQVAKNLASKTCAHPPGKDVFWYTREKKTDDDAATAELLAVKQREEELMAEVGLCLKVAYMPCLDRLYCCAMF
jgi:hypothetical protein